MALPVLIGPDDTLLGLRVGGVPVAPGALIKAQLELSTTIISQLTLTIADPDEVLLHSGFGKLDAAVEYGQLLTQVAVRSPDEVSGTYVLTLTCRTTGATALKRSFGPLVRANLSPTQMMQAEATRLSMSYVGPPSPVRASIARTYNSQTQESSWDMGVRMAGELGWVMFEMLNTLYFAPPTWLTANLPALPVLWLGRNSVNQLLARPSIREADDTTRSPLDRAQAVTGTLSVTQDLAVQLVPGTSIDLRGMGGVAPDGYDSRYWITAMSMPIDGVSPAGVSFSQAVDPAATGEPATA